MIEERMGSLDFFGELFGSVSRSKLQSRCEFAQQTHPSSWERSTQNRNSETQYSQQHNWESSNNYSPMIPETAPEDQDLVCDQSEDFFEEILEGFDDKQPNNPSFQSQDCSQIQNRHYDPILNIRYQNYPQSQFEAFQTGFFHTNTQTQRQFHFGERKNDGFRFADPKDGFSVQKQSQMPCDESKKSSSMLSWLDSACSVSKKADSCFGAECSDTDPDNWLPDINRKPAGQQRKSLIDSDIEKLDAFFGQHVKIHGLDGWNEGNFSQPGFQGQKQHFNSTQNSFAQTSNWKPEYTQSTQASQMMIPQSLPVQPQYALNSLRTESDPNMQNFFKYSLTGENSSTGIWVEQHSVSRLLPVLSKLSACFQHLFTKLAVRQTALDGVKFLINSNRLVDNDLKSVLGYGKVAVNKSTPRQLLDKMLSKIALFLVLRKSSGRTNSQLVEQLIAEGIQALLMI